ncbi:MAG: hypothetical protein RIS83_1804 [Pseudomonadota bacterium]
MPIAACCAIWVWRGKGCADTKLTPQDLPPSPKHRTWYLKHDDGVPKGPPIEMDA